MVATMAQLPMMPDVQASCAICGAPAYPQECPHEGQRLELALNQAYERWTAHHQKAMKYGQILLQPSDASTQGLD